jgi:sulfur-oxidizing protein SoxY
MSQVGSDLFRAKSQIMFRPTAVWNNKNDSRRICSERKPGNTRLLPCEASKINNSRQMKQTVLLAASHWGWWRGWHECRKGLFLYPKGRLEERKKRKIMKDKIHIKVIDRRHFVLGASAAAALAALAPMTGSSARAKGWQDFMKEAIKGATPVEGKVKLGLPEIAENGNTVPYTVTVESPMTDADHVTAIHVYAPANPGPQVLSARLSPSSGKAFFKSRMRLAKTQEVVAVAQMSDGKVYMGKTTVKVTIGGCGG